MVNNTQYDVFIIGGGINGCGIARDAAGRGYRVGLAEMQDLASGTSSKATKLIHGGLRYLEHYEFRLVRESLLERETIWAIAPHLVKPLRFVLPYHPGGVRPAWLLRLGLFLYDHIGGRKYLPATRTLNMRINAAAAPLKPLFTKAFEYSDCWVDDARFVAMNALDASERGADINTHTKVLSARREGKIWRVICQNLRDDTIIEVTTRLLVNAAGPWADKVLTDIEGLAEIHNVRLVQGSHIIVARKFMGEQAYFFQNNDGRIIFAIPYEEDFTLIGTTDQDYGGDPASVAITDAETDYLCAAASEYFREPVKCADIVWSYSGVRPLYDDGSDKAQEATRDYVLKEDKPQGQAPLINIFGGKITTYRRLSEHMLELIERDLGQKGPAWTDKVPLPGGDFPMQEFADYAAAFAGEYSFLQPDHAHRLFRQYGTRAERLLQGIIGIDGLGQHFGADLYEAEVRYLMEHEWALTAQDVLWRRTKLGLRLQPLEVTALEHFMQAAADQGKRAI